MLAHVADLEIVYAWQGVTILDCYHAEAPIIYDHPHVSILLFDKKDWATKRRTGWSDKASLKETC
jgi:hypothetical protein